MQSCTIMTRAPNSHYNYKKDASQRWLAEESSVPHEFFLSFQDCLLPLAFPHLIHWQDIWKRRECDLHMQIFLTSEYSKSTDTYTTSVKFRCPCTCAKTGTIQNRSYGDCPTANEELDYITGGIMQILHLINPVPLPDLYFDSFSYPVAPIVSSAGVLFHLTIAKLQAFSNTGLLAMVLQ